MMDMIYKAALVVITMVLLVASGTSIAATQQDLNNVNSYFDDVTTAIAESHYSADVINECIEEAAENGYVLRVEVIEGDEPGQLLYARAEMDYQYQIRLFGVSETKTKHKII